MRAGQSKTKVREPPELTQQNRVLCSTLSKTNSTLDIENEATVTELVGQKKRSNDSRLQPRSLLLRPPNKQNEACAAGPAHLFIGT